MSVTLTLIPLVLVIRAAIGSKNLNDWIESSQIKIPTNIKNENELIVLIKKAGYDVMKEGKLLKTHFNGGSDFFFLEKVNGALTATFSKNDSVEAIKKFINDVEWVAQSKIFDYNIENLAKKDEENFQEKSFPTNFVDEKLLIKTLRDYGINTQLAENGTIQCNVENTTLIFYKENSTNYEVKIIGNSQIRGIYEQLNAIDEEYKRNVQSYTYNKVVEKLKQTNMDIQSEEVMEDDSLMLTININ
ncbi:hypothetical protein [Clostridium beijerinckii]|uniref:hypothetical protein n=1 Tax=Clostridium beijerinckii TaxID=1520 RepID=UPI00156ED55F|nr:hypothetical protein [Clostridium beijerinckii]NRT73150.1 hypothetical protein [Clostridium beijerinckii]